MKKWLTAAALAGISCSAQAVTFEYPYLHKDPRAMGMGAAYTAVGGSAGAVFYNPAGLAKINPDFGFEVDLVGVNVGYNKNGKNFVKDLNDALDTGDLNGDGNTSDDELRAVNDVLLEYQGRNLHLDGSNYSSISKKGEKIGFAFGVFSGLKIDARTHQGFTPDGVLEVNSNGTMGPVLGLSYDFAGGAMNAGIGVKYLTRETVAHNFTARELVENQDTLDTYITDTLATEGKGVSFDAGIIYNPARDGFWRPSLGLSLLNIGDAKFGEAGKIPMTVNLGFAIRPRISFLDDWTFAVDYVDAANNYEEDDDFGKRLRLGGEVRLFENTWTGMALRAGMYQGYYTAGVDLRLAIVKLMFTTYAEEVGAYAGQDEDRRYLVSGSISW